MHKECFPEKGWKVFLGLKDLFTKYNVILAGGTALAFHIGHRISADLDFFTDVSFNIEAIIKGMRKSGYAFHIISEGEGYLIVEVEGLKVSIFRYDYPFLEKATMYKGFQIAGILDIASMKVIAISQRGTKRDLIDLYFIVQNMPFYKLAEHMVRRFGKERINPVHIGKSFVYFSDAESNPEPEYIKGMEVSWATIKSFFRHHVKQFVLDLDLAVKNPKS